MQHPHLLPPPPLTIEPYVPKVFGFRVRFPTEDERLALINQHEEEQGMGLPNAESGRQGSIFKP